MFKKPESFTIFIKFAKSFNNIYIKVLISNSNESIEKVSLRVKSEISEIRN